MEIEYNNASLNGLTDSHFHCLAMASKGLDPLGEVEKCKNSGMAEMIEIGLHPDDLENRRALLSGVDGIYFSSGLAPAHAADNNWRHHIETLAAQAESKIIVSIGELGLDWHWDYGTKTSQTDLMQAQLAIAKQARLPVIIHNREADADVLNILRNADLPSAGIMHCFSSDYDTAKKCIDLGFMISFAGNVTYKNADGIKNAAQKIPTQSLLVETDAPFLSPQPVRGKPNSPEHIANTYNFIAELRQTTVEKLAPQVRANLRSILNLPSNTNYRE